jgi:hypothetical protein
MALTDTEQFFYDNADYSFNPATETEDEGRIRGARELAAAEQRLENGPYFIDYRPDDKPWDGDVPYDGPLWVVNLQSVEGVSAPEVIAVLGSVACELSDPYMRVVAAQLALENIPTR